MSDKKIVIMMRHGDYEQLANTPSAWQPFALTAAGRKQAREGGVLLQDMLADHDWKLHRTVYASSLLRAWETARIITGHFDKLPGKKKLRLKENNKLAERSVGNLANLSLDQIEEVMANDPRYDTLPKGWKSDSHFCLPVPGAESLLDSGARIAKFVNARMAHVKKGEALLLVGHGAAFRHAAHHMGVMSLDDVAARSMFHARPVALQQRKNGAWRVIDGKWKIRDRKDKVLD